MLNRREFYPVELEKVYMVNVLNGDRVLQAYRKNGRHIF